MGWRESLGVGWANCREQRVGGWYLLSHHRMLPQGVLLVWGPLVWLGFDWDQHLAAVQMQGERGQRATSASPPPAFLFQDLSPSPSCPLSITFSSLPNSSNLKPQPLLLPSPGTA